MLGKEFSPRSEHRSASKQTTMPDIQKMVEETAAGKSALPAGDMAVAVLIVSLATVLCKSCSGR
jgi:hypothetical protein